jgi:hypothetical protein
LDPENKDEERMLTLVALQTDFPSASNRACSIQKNACAQAANAQKKFTVNQCDTQERRFPIPRLQLQLQLQYRTRSLI